VVQRNTPYILKIFSKKLYGLYLKMEGVIPPYHNVVHMKFYKSQTM
jgi:hypothetical protein